MKTSSKSKAGLSGPLRCLPEWPSRQNIDFGEVGIVIERDEGCINFLDCFAVRRFGYERNFKLRVISFKVVSLDIQQKICHIVFEMRYKGRSLPF